MDKAVLLVDGDERRRRQVAAELLARGVPVLEQTNAFDALARLDGVVLGAVVLAEDRNLSSQRALCRLARERHPEVCLVLLAPAAVERRTVEASMGVSLAVLEEDAPPGGIAAHVLAWMKRPIAAPLETSPARDPTPSPYDVCPSSVNAGARVSEPLLTGELDEERAASLLSTIHERLLTGRLEVEGVGTKGCLYFYRGEPVAADHERGDAGLLDELERHDLVPSSLDIGFVPEGELLATLVTAGNVTGEAMHRFVGDFVRRRLFDVVLRGRGSYRFVDDARFLEHAPLLHVDLPALLAEWERSRSLPDAAPAPVALDEDARVREEVLNLYMRLKPLSHPRQVLGVPLWADKAAIEAAYRRRLEETDPSRLPPGPSREMLASRLEELRAKVMGAREALTLQQGQGTAGPAAVWSATDSNPF